MRLLGVWAAEFKESGDFIGWFMLMKTQFEFPELGFMIVKKYWGAGLTTEISFALMDYGFNSLKLNGMVAKTDPANFASIRVLEKLGFEFLKMISVTDKVMGGQVKLKVFQKVELPT